MPTCDGPYLRNTIRCQKVSEDFISAFFLMQVTAVIALLAAGLLFCTYISVDLRVFSAFGILAWLELICPALLYLNRSRRDKVNRIRDQLSVEAMEWYYRAFRPEALRSECQDASSIEGLAEDHPNRRKIICQKFERLVGDLHSPYRYLVAYLVFVLSSVASVGVISLQLLLWLGIPLAAEQPDMSIPASALIGAYIWVMYDQLRRIGSGDLAPRDIYWWGFRFIISVPVAVALVGMLESHSIIPTTGQTKVVASQTTGGPQVAQTTKEQAGPTGSSKPKETGPASKPAPTPQAQGNDHLGIGLAMMLGLFPTSALMRFGRRFVIQKLEGSEGKDESEPKCSLEQIQGVTRDEAERFRELGINTIVDLSYADPILLAMKTNFGFHYLLDCISQALLIRYLGDVASRDDTGYKWAQIRVLGLRGAMEAVGLYEMLASCPPGADSVDKKEGAGPPSSGGGDAAGAAIPVALAEPRKGPPVHSGKLLRVSLRVDTSGGFTQQKLGGYALANFKGIAKIVYGDDQQAQDALMITLIQIAEDPFSRFLYENWRLTTPPRRGR